MVKGRWRRHLIAEDAWERRQRVRRRRDDDDDDAPAARLRKIVVAL
jgi:hypothetical protein